MKLLASLILCFTLIISTYGSSVPLTMCISGRAQGTESLNKSGSCEYGTYNGATGPGTFTATLNEFFYSSGVKCGDCFEVSGPKGKTVVRVVNFCSAGTCPSEKPLFMLTPDAFEEISSDPLSVVYDAGFRKVSCDSKGPIKAQVSDDSSKYYVKLLIFNNEIGVKDVTIKGKDMTESVTMVRQNSAQFVWSQAGKEMKFPAQVNVTSQYGGPAVTMTLTSLSMDILKFSGNFVTPKSFIIKNAPKTCALSASPVTIYSNGLTEGWNYWSSRSYSMINTSDTSVHSVGGKKSLSIILMGSSSSLTLARSGDFQTNYFTGIKFNMRSNTTLTGVRVYFPNEQEKYWTPLSPINSTWTTYIVPFSSLQHKSIESAITWANTENVNAYIYIDSISFIPSPTAATSGYTSSGSGLNTDTATGVASSTTTGAASSTTGLTGISTSDNGSMGATTTKTTSNPSTTTSETTEQSTNNAGTTTDDDHNSSSRISSSLLLISLILAFFTL